MVRKITMARKPRIHYPGTVYHVIRYIHLNPVRAKDPIDYSLSSHAAYTGHDEDNKESLTPLPYEKVEEEIGNVGG